MSEDAFLNVLADAAADAGRNVTTHRKANAVTRSPGVDLDAGDPLPEVHDLESAVMRDPGRVKDKKDIKKT